MFQPVLSLSAYTTKVFEPEMLRPLMDLARDEVGMTSLTKPFDDQLGFLHANNAVLVHNLHFEGDKSDHCPRRPFSVGWRGVWGVACLKQHKIYTFNPVDVVNKQKFGDRVVSVVNAVELCGLYLHPLLRGQKWGEKLTDYRLARAKAMPGTITIIEVRPDPDNPYDEFPLPHPDALGVVKMATANGFYLTGAAEDDNSPVYVLPGRWPNP